MSDQIVEDAWAFLRSHTTGDLRFDEHIRSIRYVIAPDGRMIAPVMVAMLQSYDTIVFVPEYAEGAMEFGVTLEELLENGPDGHLTDRWRIYHGQPEDVRWAVIHIDTARFERTIIDGESLKRANPLAGDESGLCRFMNQDHRDQLRRLCARHAGVEMEEPTMVGIDPLGLDVRGEFAVYRVPLAEKTPDAAHARRVLEAMIAGVADDG